MQTTSIDLFNLPATDPRLAPIEKPAGVFMRLLYIIGRRLYGKILTPLTVIYSRAPQLVLVSQAILWSLNRLCLKPQVYVLVQIATAMHNGCTFCADLAVAHGMQKKIGRSKFKALAVYIEQNCPQEFSHPDLDASELAAIQFGLKAARHRVSNQDFLNVRQYFSERETIELAFIAAMECYYNTLNGALGIGSDSLALRASTRIGSRRSHKPG